MSDALPYKLNLLRRGIETNRVCSRCNKVDEDLYHTFYGCYCVKQFWLLSPLGIRLNLDGNGAFIHYLIDKHNTEPKEILELIAFSCWGSWSKKNEIIFETISDPPNIVVHHIFGLYANYNRENESRSNIENQLFIAIWMPPIGKRVKLNTDVAFVSNGIWHSGAVYRYATGQILASR